MAFVQNQDQTATEDAPLTTVGLVGQPVPQTPRQMFGDNYLSKMDDWIYYNTYSVSAATELNKNLFSIVTFSMENVTGTPFVPWSAMYLDYCARANYQIEFMILPVKLPNSRVTLQADFRYSMNIAANATTNASTMKENLRFEIDKPAPIFIKPKLFWIGNQPLASGYANKDSIYYKLGVVPPKPGTQVDFSVVHEFMPNQLAPDSFSLLIFFRVVDVNAIGNYVDPDQPFSVFSHSRYTIV